METAQGLSGNEEKSAKTKVFAGQINLSDGRTGHSIVAPNFQQGNKWRVSDGSRNIFVSIEDPAFVGAVQSGREAFRKGDILNVKLQTRQWMEGSDLKAEHAIIKVLGHERAPRNLSLLPDQDEE